MPYEIIDGDGFKEIRVRGSFTMRDALKVMVCLIKSRRIPCLWNFSADSIPSFQQSLQTINYLRFFVPDAFRNPPPAALLAETEYQKAELELSYKGLEIMPIKIRTFLTQDRDAAIAWLLEENNGASDKNS